MIGQVNNQPKANRAAIQGYWSEVLAWVPSIALTDPRVRWEAVDDTTVRLYLPGLDDAEAFTVRFAADTGLISQIETMRYQNEDNAERWHWFNRILRWGTVDGLRVPVRAQTQWRVRLALGNLGDRADSSERRCRTALGTVWWGCVRIKALPTNHTLFRKSRSAALARADVSVRH